MNIIPSRISITSLRLNISELPLGAQCSNYRWICAAHLSPALNESSEISHFQCSDAIEICNRIMFVFYPGLPHVDGSFPDHLYLPLFSALTDRMPQPASDCGVCEDQDLELLSSQTRSGEEGGHRIILIAAVLLFWWNTQTHIFVAYVLPDIMAHFGNCHMRCLQCHLEDSVGRK